MSIFNYKFDFIPLTDNLTNFEKDLSNLEKIRYLENPINFYKEAAYFKKIDKKFTYYYLFSKIKSRDYIEGSGYLTHGFDFYQGSFHAQMIRGLINSCNLKKKSTILDPFCGCGTTLIESKLLNFNSIGIDINPIACLNSKIKTELLDINIEILKNNNEKFFDLNYYSFLKEYENFFEILNLDIRTLFFIFLYTRAISDYYYISKNMNKAFIDNYHNILTTLLKFNILKKSIDLPMGKTKIYHSDNLKRLHQLKSNSIDAIITSPPYIDLIDYISNDLNQIKIFLNESQIKYLRLFSIGNKFSKFSQTEKIYWYKMERVFYKLFDILKSNHHFILIIGDYKNMKEKFLNLSKKIGFKTERILLRKIINKKDRISYEHVLFLLKV